MPRRIIPLSDAKIKNAKPREKDYKLIDGGGPTTGQCTLRGAKR